MPKKNHVDPAISSGTSPSRLASKKQNHVDPATAVPQLRPGPRKKSVLPITVSASFTPSCLSVSSAALYLGGVTEWFVEEELLRSGEVPFHLFGNQRVIEVVELDRWLSKQKKQTGKLVAPFVQEVAA